MGIQSTMVGAMVIMVMASVLAMVVAKILRTEKHNKAGVAAAVD